MISGWDLGASFQLSYNIQAALVRQVQLCNPTLTFLGTYTPSLPVLTAGSKQAWARLVLTDLMSNLTPKRLVPPLSSASLPYVCSMRKNDAVPRFCAGHQLRYAQQH